MNALIDSLVDDVLDHIFLNYLRDYLAIVCLVSKRWFLLYRPHTFAKGFTMKDCAWNMLNLGHAHVTLWAFKLGCPIDGWTLEQNLSKFMVSSANNGTIEDIKGLLELRYSFFPSIRMNITFESFETVIQRAGPGVLDLMGIPEFSGGRADRPTTFLKALWNEDTDTVRAAQVMWKHVSPPASYFVIAAHMNRPEFMAALDKQTLESCRTHLLNAYKVALEHKSSDFVRWLDANDYAPSYSEVRHLWEKIGWNLDGVQESG